MKCCLWDHSFSTYAKFSKKLTFIFPLIRIPTCEYEGVRNVVLQNICLRINWIIPVAAEYWKVLKYRGVFRTL